MSTRRRRREGPEGPEEEAPVVAAPEAPEEDEPEAPADEPEPEVPGAPGADPEVEVVPAVEPPFEFAYTPAHAVHGVINYNTKMGALAYKVNNRYLEEKFGGDAEELLPFIKAVSAQAFMCHWTMCDGIQMGTRTYNLFESYGSISLEALRVHVNGYLNAQNRDTQNAYLMYNFLQRSVLKTIDNRAQLRSHLFILRKENGQLHIDGLLYFKVLTQLAQVDTIATITTLTNQMSKLETVMFEMEHDIIAFNDSASHLINGLEARSVTVDDRTTIVNLFRGYLACVDSTFHAYIKNLQDNYDDQSRHLTPHSLMHLAQNKYTLIQQKGEWLAKTEDQEKLMVLTARMEALQVQVQRKRKADDRGGKPKAKTESKAKKPKQQGGKARSTENKKGRRKYADWQYQAPKAGEAKTKTVNARTYHWCSKHKLWSRHQESDCTLQSSTKGPSKEAKLRPDTNALHAAFSDGSASEQDNV